MIQNLPEGTNEEGLRQMFSVFGEISSLKINTDDKGMPIGEAFVCFVESSSAEEAIK